jgi:Transposase DDE domain group 1
MGRSTINTVNVVADGTGLSSRAGSALLGLMAQRLGLTDGLSAALAGTRERRSEHDPGRVFCDLAVMAADGGRCVSDLAVLAGQPALFGNVASVSTARRVLLSVGEAELDRVRRARALARGRAWEAGAAPERVILDFDATPITIHSEKEDAAGHYKGGFGFNPLLATCGREVLAGILRPGNAGANNADDHSTVLELALEQLPQSALDGEILARSDSAGASHKFAFGCRECRIRFSLGYKIDERVREAILALGEPAWRPATDQDGGQREGAWVAELTGQVNLEAWPTGTRLICRRQNKLSALEKTPATITAIHTHPDPIQPRSYLTPRAPPTAS